MLFRHLLPNVLSSLPVQAAVDVPRAVEFEASLSCLGLGVAVTTPSLGLGVAQGYQYLFGGAWWPSVVPGLAVVLPVLAENLLGDVVRDATAPHYRRRPVRHTQCAGRSAQLGSEWKRPMAFSPPAELLETATRRAVALRRDLHRHPELGLTEFRTASLVAQRLEALGLDVKLGRQVMDSASRVGLPDERELERCYRRAAAEGASAAFLPALAGGHTAVVGLLKGADAGPVVALRVDMDALPIHEDETQAHLPAREGFASIHPGVMHACGHDVHTALGLAAAEVLSRLRDRVKGTVKFLFQPAEEGGRGAAPMVRAGVVEDVDHFVAIHIGTGVPSLSACAAVNGHLASVKLDTTFRGRSAHAGGQPDQGRNALLAAAEAVQALYAISRHHAGRSRVNVGTMRAGSGRNVIADHAFLEIEVRGETEEIAEYMRRRAEAALQGAALMQDVKVEVRIVGRTTTADSDPELARLIAEAGAEMPAISISAVPHQAGGSEDATYFMRRVQKRGGKAAYAVIGSDLASGHHTPRFDIDESDIGWGIELLARTLLRLGSDSKAE